MGMELLLMMAQTLTPEHRTSAIIWLSVIGAVVILGGVAIMLIRRMFTDPEKGSADADTGFSLSSLKEMRDQGEITPEEYERARAKIIAKIKGTE